MAPKTLIDKIEANVMQTDSIELQLEGVTRLYKLLSEKRISNCGVIHRLIQLLHTTERVQSDAEHEKLTCQIKAGAMCALHLLAETDWDDNDWFTGNTRPCTTMAQHGIFDGLAELLKNTSSNQAMCNGVMETVYYIAVRSSNDVLPCEVQKLMPLLSNLLRLNITLRYVPCVLFQLNRNQCVAAECPIPNGIPTLSTCVWRPSCSCLTRVSRFSS